MNEKNIDDLARGWINYSEIEEGDPAREALVHYEDKLQDEIDRDPEFALRTVFRIIELTENEMVLACAAAGPLESLLSWHGPDLIAIVEARAGEDRKFRGVLNGVWRNAIESKIWDRLQALRIK